MFPARREHAPSFRWWLIWPKSSLRNRLLSYYKNVHTMCSFIEERNQYRYGHWYKIQNGRWDISVGSSMHILYHHNTCEEQWIKTWIKMLWHKILLTHAAVLLELAWREANATEGSFILKMEIACCYCCLLIWRSFYFNIKRVRIAMHWNKQPANTSKKGLAPPGQGLTE